MGSKRIVMCVCGTLYERVSRAIVTVCDYLTGGG